jgi:hypothetical protein
MLDIDRFNRRTVHLQDLLEDTGGNRLEIEYYSNKYYYVEIFRDDERVGCEVYNPKATIIGLA